MTEVEAAIQRYLDDNPRDNLARLALADHLDDVGNDRAVGYRALGELGRSAVYNGRVWYWFGTDNVRDSQWGFHVRCDTLTWEWEELAHQYYNSRQECDDAAARGWLLLSESQRDRILEASCPA